MSTESSASSVAPRPWAASAPWALSVPAVPRRRRTLICWPSLVTATTIRTSRAAGVLAGDRGGVGSIGDRSALPSGGSTIRSTTIAAPGQHPRRATRSGPGTRPDPRRPGAPGCSKVVRAGPPSTTPSCAARAGLLGADVIGRDEGEEQGGLVPPVSGDVPLDIERGGEQVLDVHGTSLPAQGADSHSSSEPRTSSGGIRPRPPGVDPTSRHFRCKDPARTRGGSTDSVRVRAPGLNSPPADRI